MHAFNSALDLRQEQSRWDTTFDYFDHARNEVERIFEALKAGATKSGEPEGAEAARSMPSYEPAFKGVVRTIERTPLSTERSEALIASLEATLARFEEKRQAVQELVEAHLLPEQQREQTVRAYEKRAEEYQRVRHELGELAVRLEKEYGR